MSQPKLKWIIMQLVPLMVFGWSWGEGEGSTNLGVLNCNGAKRWFLSASFKEESADVFVISCWSSKGLGCKTIPGHPCSCLFSMFLSCRRILSYVFQSPLGVGACILIYIYTLLLDRVHFEYYIIVRVTYGWGGIRHCVVNVFSCERMEKKK